MAFLDENGVAQLWAAVKDRLADAFDSVEFDVAEQAANLMSGDSIATAFGKLAKNYSSLLTSISDLNTNLTSQINTKLNKSDVLANYTTTATGKALDASLGPAIKTKMDLADTLNTRVSKIEGRQVLYAFANTPSYPAYHTWHDGASVVIPANSGRWLILGQTNITHYSGETQLLCNIKVDPHPETAVRNGSRSIARDGVGVSTWGYALNYGTDRTVGVNTYVYDQIPSTGDWFLSTAVAAINLGVLS